MENRVTLKDVLLFALVLAGIVITLLAMKQYDRQYVRVVLLESQANNITKDLSELRELVRTLAARPAPTAAGPTTQQASGSEAPTVDTAANPELDPFIRIREARTKPDYSRGDWFIENFGSRIGRITPLITTDTYGAAIQSRVMETLLTRDPQTLKYRGLLAESFKVSEDGLEVTYKLRKGVRFSDGTPFDADDVIFSFEWIMNPAVDAPRERSYLQDQKITWKKLNDYEVSFRMEKPYFEFLNITGQQLIMCKSFISKFTPTQYNEHPGLLLGTGPYRMASPDGWRPGTPIEMFRNERYWGEAPAFDRVIYTEVEEEAASAAMFQNGQIDYLSCTPEMYDSMKADPSLKDRAKPLEYTSMLGGYTYVAWNQRNKAGSATPFADKRVRQAMTMLIDRNRLANDFYRGYATPAAGPFARLGRQAAPDVEPWPFDVAKAKELLAAAGIADRNSDGIVDGVDGQPFRFRLIFPAKSELTSRMATFIKDSFARAGVVCQLEPTDWPVLLERMKSSDFDAAMLGWSSSVESDLYQIFHSSQIGDRGDNRTFYISPELDKLIEQARSTVDEEKRMPLWQAAARVIHEDQPYTFLLNRKALRFVDSRVKNIEPASMGLNFMVTEVMPLPWYAASGQQKYGK